MRSNLTSVNKILKVFLLIILTPHLYTAQQDFNHYSSLVSVGEIPSDFSVTTREKIQSDKASSKTSLSKKKEKIFLEGIHYSIDEILHSGMVLYGDEITNYVISIVDKLLVNESELREKLRFYSLKSNATNAFCTDQGIIFVTTGLIAQVENEAQLAYVLGHEIAHFKLNHIVETFDYQISLNRKDITIEKLSQYSKDKEFEADKLGIKFYNDAGYSKKHVTTTFDVLNYSYLPFDEVPISKEYFNNKYITIPDEFFPKEKFTIKAQEDENDSQSSHPNIASRKSAAENEMNNVYSNWGDKSNLIGDQKFDYIQTIARFETIRKDIMTGKYVDALYAINILESKYPNSEYLSSMKTKAWFGISQLTEKKKLNSYLTREKNLEGEIGTMHYVFRKLKNEAIYTLAIRNVYDSYLNNPNNTEIKAIWTKFVGEIASTKLFKLEEFASISYQEAKTKFEAEKATNDSTQTIKVEVTEDKLSKYEKIKKKKNTNDPSNFDESKFYLYGLPDLIRDPIFLAAYQQNKSKADSIKLIEDRLNSLSKKERKKLKKEYQNTRFQYGLSDLIVVEPIVNYYKKGKIIKTKSEKLAKIFSEAMDLAGKESGLNITTISRFNLDKLGTIGYNERSILTSYLSQLTLEREIEPFPVDYQLLRDIETNYGTSYILFTLLEHNYSAKLNAGKALSILYCPPCATVIIPFALLRGNHSEFNFIVMDINKGTILDGKSTEYNNPVSKYIMGAYVYDLFSQFKMQPL